MLREAGFKHEAHGVVELLGLQLCVGGAFKGVFVGAVGQHHIVQGHAARNEAFGFGIILTVDVAHELGHDVLVIPWRAERVFSHHPALAEEHEVDIGCAFLARGGGEDCEDAWVRVIKQDRADGAICAEVVFHGGVIAVPRDDIKGAVADFGFVELAAPFDCDR